MGIVSVKVQITGVNARSRVNTSLHLHTYIVSAFEKATCLTLYPVLQQTRVSTVIPYFNNWISKWPTVQDLAESTHDEVLAAWKGLGYYSRATRLHEGAKAMIAKSPSSSLPIPSLASDLQKFPGIGRYTAGAISSIAFGEAEPVLDGNVARVLSRQLGLYVNVKDKKSTDLLWEVADQLIKHVSKFPDAGKSSIPGQWNQAMMELGSTVCTPRPRCDECPIQATCRALKEGQALSKRKEETTPVPDIEDACSRCESLDTEDLVVEINQIDLEEQPRPSKKVKTSTKQSNTISRYFTSNVAKANEESLEDESNDTSRKRKPPLSSTLSHTAIAYCSLFPKRVAKKQVAQEECVVCMIELFQPDGSSKWLIEQRPAKGKSSKTNLSLCWVIDNPQACLHHCGMYPTQPSYKTLPICLHFYYTIIFTCKNTLGWILQSLSHLLSALETG